jgi:hypothetical protein
MTNTANLEVFLGFTPARVISGESLSAEVTLRNVAAEPVSVPSPRSASSFSYELTRRDGSTETLAISFHRYENRITARVLAPHDKLTPMSLAPGGKTRVRDDLAYWNGEPIPPGTYDVVASASLLGADVWSNSATVAIEPPDFVLFSSALAPLEGVLTRLGAHREPDGSLVLYQQESIANFPGSGVFYPRRRIAAGVPAHGLATCVNAGDVIGPRWFAWLEDGFVGANQTWGTQIESAPPLLPVEGLENARLLHPGFFFPDRTACFCLIRPMNAGFVLSVYRVTPEAIQLEWDVKMPIPLPARVRMRYREGSAAPWQLIWMEPHAEGERIRALLFDRSGRPVGTPLTELAILGEPFLAWDAPAVGDGHSPDWLQVLSGPGKEGDLCCRRIGLSMESQEVNRLDFAVPFKMSAARWALGHSAEINVPLLAAVGEDLLAGWAGSSHWTRLTGEAERLRYLSILSLRCERFFAEWVHPEHGIQLEMFPVMR